MPNSLKIVCTIILMIGLYSISYAQSDSQYYVESFSGNNDIEFGIVHILDRKGNPIKGPDKKTLKPEEYRKTALRPNNLATFYSDLFRLSKEKREKKLEELQLQLDKIIYITNSYTYNLKKEYEKFFKVIVSYKKRNENTVFTSVYIKSVEPTYKYKNKTTTRLHKLKINYQLIATNYVGDTLYNKTQSIDKLVNTKFSLSRNTIFLILDDMIAALKSTKPTTLSKPKVTVTTNGTHHLSSNNSISIIHGNDVISGIVIDKDAYAFTDYRIFVDNQDQAVKVVLSNSNTCDIQLVRYNKLHNIVLIKIIKPTLKFANLSTNGQLDKLDKVKFWGVPGNLSLSNSYSEGQVANTLTEKNQQYYLIDAMPHWAYTGAGIFDGKGHLAGVSLLRSYDKHLNLVMPCLSINNIIKILELK